MTEDKEFPKTDWGLCKRPASRNMIGGLCIYYGLFAAWGKCMAPGVRRNAVCHPIKKYRSDLKFIMNSPGLESRKIKKIVDK